MPGRGLRAQAQPVDGLRRRPGGGENRQADSDMPTDFSKLPTVSFVVPNLCHDMHDCSVKDGDHWLAQNIDPYARWARTHNSLLILTFDESEADGDRDNHIATVAVGERVMPGPVTEKTDHYRLLRTIEDLYGLQPLGHSAEARREDRKLDADGDLTGARGAEYRYWPRAAAAAGRPEPALRRGANTWPASERRPPRGRAECFLVGAGLCRPCAGSGGGGRRGGAASATSISRPKPCARGWERSRCSHRSRGDPRPSSWRAARTTAHTLGMEALGALLVHAGRRCCVLGARTPGPALLATVERVEPAAVVVVSRLSMGRRLAMAAVRTVATPGVPTFYAGNAFISTSTRHRIPGIHLSDSLSDAVRVVETALAG